MLTPLRVLHLTLIAATSDIGISSVTPETGPVEGFTTVTLVGVNFNAEWLKRTGCRCQFGTEVSEYEIQVLNSTHMTCVSPRQNAGTYPIYLVVISTSTLLKATEVTFEYFPSMLVADRQNNQVLRFNANTGVFIDAYIQPNAGTCQCYRILITSQQLTDKDYLDSDLTSVCTSVAWSCVQYQILLP